MATKAELEAMIAELQSKLGTVDTPPTTVPATATADAPALTFVALPPKPERRASATARAHGITPNLIPMGQAVEVLKGTCDNASHKATVGKPFTLYCVGLCGDWDGQRRHKGCAADKGKSPCGGRVFEVRGDGACAVCARQQRKAKEAAS